MGEREEKSRKTRSDKKKAIAPFVSDMHRVWIYRMARHLEKPEGDIGLILVQTALYNKDCVDYFSDYFKRGYQFNQYTVYPGHKKARNIDDYLVIEGKKDRFKIKATQELAGQLSDFQIALGTPYIAYATHALLKYALHDDRIIKYIAPDIDLLEIRKDLEFKREIKSKSSFSIL